MDYEYLHAVILGVVQGVAEFLPISSSGHLVIADALLREYSGTTAPRESVTMGIALHFGTLMSILLVYRHDLLALLKDRWLMWLIVVATIPVGFAGLALKDYVDQAFGEPLLVGMALLVTAVFLMVGRALQTSGRDLSNMSIRMATIVGVFQAIAIVPGISRSGSTIAAGMACGLKREQAARFSFLIAIPAIGGATVMELKDLVSGEKQFDGSLLPLALGTLISFVIGVFALRWLIRLVVADRLHGFAIYCVVVGVATVLWQLSLR